MHELVVEIRARGSVAMIPEGPCKALRIGPRTVADVLVILAEHADRHCRAWPGLERIAAELGFTKNEVYRARRVLVETGLIVPAGKVGKSSAYVLNVDAWPDTMTLIPVPVDNSTPTSGPTYVEPSVEPSVEPYGDPHTKQNRSESATTTGADQHLPMVVGVAAADGHAADEKTLDLRQVMEAGNVPDRNRPTMNGRIRRAMAKAAANGHTATSLGRLLQAENLGYTGSGPALVLTVLEALASQPVPKEKPTFENTAWCGQCDVHDRREETATGVRICPRCHPSRVRIQAEPEPENPWLAALHKRPDPAVADLVDDVANAWTSPTVARIGAAV